jgi:hypothetical protein
VAEHPIGPDPERDARVDAYRDRERRRAARALDRYIESVFVETPGLGMAACKVAGDRFVEQVGDYVVARLTGRWDEVAQHNEMPVTDPAAVAAEWNRLGGRHATCADASGLGEAPGTRWVCTGGCPR